MSKLNELISKKNNINAFMEKIERLSKKEIKNVEDIQNIKEELFDIISYFYSEIKKLIELDKEKSKQLDALITDLNIYVETDLQKAFKELIKFGEVLLEAFDLEIESQEIFENIENLKGSKQQQVIAILKGLEKKLKKIENDKSIDIEVKLNIILTYLKTIETIFNSIQKNETFSKATVEKFQKIFDSMIEDFENNNISNIFSKLYPVIDALIEFLDDSKIDDSKIDDSKIDDSKIDDSEIDFDMLLGKIDELSIDELYDSSLMLINTLEEKLKEFQEDIKKTPFGEIILNQFPEARRKLEEMKKYEDINELRNFLRFQITTIKMVFDLQKDS